MKKLMRLTINGLFMGVISEQLYKSLTLSNQNKIACIQAWKIFSEFIIKRSKDDFTDYFEDVGIELGENEDLMECLVGMQNTDSGYYELWIGHGTHKSHVVIVIEPAYFVG